MDILESAAIGLHDEIKRNLPNLNVGIDKPKNKNEYKVSAVNILANTSITVVLTEVGYNLTIKALIKVNNKVTSTKYKIREVTRLTRTGRGYEIRDKYSAVEVYNQSVNLTGLSDAQIALLGWNAFQVTYNILNTGAYM